MSTALNPFGNVKPTASNVLAEVESARSVQEVQAAMVIAKKFPRNAIAAMDNILASCKRITLAENALYAYKRGDSIVKGPSIRLAEAIAQNWGNMQFGIEELSQEGGVSIVKAYAWDIQTNTKQEKKFQVPHVRYTKNNGSIRLIDPRDIYETIANQGARRLRACILGVIPGDVIDAAVLACEETIKKSEVTIDAGTIAALTKSFNALGVNKEMLNAYLRKDVQKVDEKELSDLRSIYASIKDGITSIAEWFGSDEIKVNPSTSRLKNIIGIAKEDPQEEVPEPSPDVLAKASELFKDK